MRLKEEFGIFLKEELQLELSPLKTRITHVNDGFDFLGFHVQRYVSAHDRPKLLVTPASKNILKLKQTIKEMTKRKWFQAAQELKFSAMNAVLGGWINYYRHSNAKEIAKDLDFWVNQRLFRWLGKRHKLSSKHIIKMYKLREHGRRFNLGIRNGEKYLYLYRPLDLPLTKYRSRSPENPYIQGEHRTGMSIANTPLSQQVWLGNADNSQWRELKETIPR